MVVEGYRVKAVLFDFDGTLTRPGALDFDALRRELGCPARMPVLECIQGMAEDARRRRAWEALDRFEERGAVASRPNEGAKSLVRRLKQKGLMVGILTRNCRAAVLRALQNFGGLGPADFDLIVTRDDPVLPKPAGDGVRYAAEHLGVDLHQVLVVGDFHLDMQAGHAAGAMTVLLDPAQDSRMADVPCDWRIRQLAELMAIVAHENGRLVP